uniref:Uncharacterized protein n=1 Tax=Anopheles merus TaxID=30066 RepID=A0A182UQU1_ANOME
MAKAGLCRIGSPSGDEMKTKNNGRKQEQQTPNAAAKRWKRNDPKNPPHRDPGPRSRTFLRSRCLSRCFCLFVMIKVLFLGWTGGKHGFPYNLLLRDSNNNINGT